MCTRILFTGILRYRNPYTYLGILNFVIYSKDNIVVYVNSREVTLNTLIHMHLYVCWLISVA